MASIPGVAIWLTVCLLITSILGEYPSLMPRHGIAIDAVHNHKHSPNGVTAKAKAIAKFAHLVDQDTSKNLLNGNGSCVFSVPLLPNHHRRSPLTVSF